MSVSCVLDICCDRKTRKTWHNLTTHSCCPNRQPKASPEGPHFRYKISKIGFMSPCGSPCSHRKPENYILGMLQENAANSCIEKGRLKTHFSDVLLKINVLKLWTSPQKHHLQKIVSYVNLVVFHI